MLGENYDKKVIEWLHHYQSLIKLTEDNIDINQSVRDQCIAWQENPRSPSILPNGEHQVNPVLTVRFLMSKNVRLILRLNA